MKQKLLNERVLINNKDNESYEKIVYTIFMS